MTSINYTEFQNLLAGNSLSSFVSNDISDSVSDEKEQWLKHLEDRMNILGGGGQTAMSQSELMEIHNNLTELAVEAETELSSNGAIAHISINQANFIKRMLALTATIQSYQLLLSDRDTINTIYSRLLQLHITKDLDLGNIESLLQTNSASSNFINNAISYTTVSMDSVLGIEKTVLDVEESVLHGPIIDTAYNFVILCGPPGTGKSTISHAMATLHSGGKYYNLNIGDLLSGTVGISEKGIRELFGQLEASNENVTLILDEVDIILGDGANKPAYFQSVRTTLQTEISGSRFLKSNTLIIGITNHLDKILDVFKRRASTIIYVPTPEREQLTDMLIKEMGVKRSQVTDELIQYLNKEFLDQGFFWTAANLKSFIRNAKIQFFKRNNKTPVWAFRKNNKLYVHSNVYIEKGVKPAKGFVAELKDQGIPVVVVPEIQDFEAARNLVYVLSAKKHEEWFKKNSMGSKSKEDEDEHMDDL